MALHSATVGSVGQPFVSEIDARWVMSYAAGLDDYLPCYMDTCRPDGIVAHPLFPVCIEWPVMLAMRDSALKREEALRGVHATHDLVIHRLIRAGEKLTTQATVAGVEQRKPGPTRPFVSILGTPMVSRSVRPGTERSFVGLPSRERIARSPTCQLHWSRLMQQPGRRRKSRWRFRPGRPISTLSVRVSGTRFIPTRWWPSSTDCRG